MRLTELIRELNLSVRSANGDLERQVAGGYAGDLLRDVLAHGREADLWVTLQAHQNIVAIASMKNLAGIAPVNGREPDQETIEKVLDPFFTTRTTRRVGLGLSLFAQAARESGGTIELDSAPGRGTTVRATFHPSHPDCRPLGDLYETIRTLIVGHPEIDFLFEHKSNGSVYHFDTKQADK